MSQVSQTPRYSVTTTNGEVLSSLSCQLYVLAYCQNSNNPFIPANVVVSEVVPSGAPAQNAPITSAPKVVKPRAKSALSLSIDAVCEEFDNWQTVELEACVEEIEGWHAGRVTDIDLASLENWHDEVAKAGRLAWSTFWDENPEVCGNYVTQSQARKAKRAAKLHHEKGFTA